MKFIKFAFVFATLTTCVFAHAGHDHGKEPVQIQKPSTSSEHPSVSGRLFEVVLERCEADKVYLYVSDSQTNQAISDAQIEITASGDITLTTKAEATKSAGVYLLPLKAKDGNKVSLDLKISTPKASETVTLTVAQWPKSSEKCSQ